MRQCDLGALVVNEQLGLWCRFGHDLLDLNNVVHGRGGEPRCKICLRSHLAAVRRWRTDRCRERPPSSDLRRVQLSDGRTVLVDADDPNDDDAIRIAIEEMSE